MAHGAFKKPRRLINLEFELQILMTAEFIAEAYYAILRYPTLSYAILRDLAEDPVITPAYERILRDVVKHLHFQGDFFATRQQTWHPLTRLLWSCQCHAIFMITAYVVWFDHRPNFQALGASYGEFSGPGKRSIRAFRRRITRHLN